MKIALASDHAGYTLKEEIKAHLQEAGQKYGRDSPDVASFF